MMSNCYKSKMKHKSYSSYIFKWYPQARELFAFSGLLSEMSWGIALIVAISLIPLPIDCSQEYQASSNSTAGHQAPQEFLKTVSLAVKDHRESTVSLSSDSSSASMEEVKFPFYMRTVATLACLVILTIGVCGNLLVPLVVIKTKYLRNSTNLFLINLSIADLLVLTVCMPTVLIELHSRPETWLLGEVMCKLTNYVETLAANGSIFTILAISFERYYAICKPLKAGYKCTRLRATIIICVIWLLASILSSPVLIMAKSSETIYIDGSRVFNCILETDSYWARSYVLVSIFAFFCLPLVVLMIVYWLISRRLIRENLAMSSCDSSPLDASSYSKLTYNRSFWSRFSLSSRQIDGPVREVNLHKGSSSKSVATFFNSLHHQHDNYPFSILNYQANASGTEANYRSQVRVARNRANRLLSRKAQSFDHNVLAKSNVNHKRRDTHTGTRSSLDLGNSRDTQTDSRVINKSNKPDDRSCTGGRFLNWLMMTPKAAYKNQKRYLEGTVFQARNENRGEKSDGYSSVKGSGDNTTQSTLLNSYTDTFNSDSSSCNSTSKVRRKLESKKRRFADYSSNPKPKCIKQFSISSSTASVHTNSTVLPSDSSISPSMNYTASSSNHSPRSILHIRSESRSSRTTCDLYRSDNRKVAHFNEPSNGVKESIHTNYPSQKDAPDIQSRPSSSNSSNISTSGRITPNSSKSSSPELVTSNEPNSMANSEHRGHHSRVEFVTSNQEPEIRTCDTSKPVISEQTHVDSSGQDYEARDAFEEQDSLVTPIFKPYGPKERNVLRTESHRLYRSSRANGRRCDSQPIVCCHLQNNQAPELVVVRDLSKKQQMHSRRQVVVMLAFVVACFFLLFFPYRVFTIWLIFSTEDQVQSLGMETYYNLTYFSRILIYLHSAINPIAYNLISTKFRKAFMSILLCRGSDSRRSFANEQRQTNNKIVDGDARKYSMTPRQPNSDCLISK